MPSALLVHDAFADTHSWAATIDAAWQLGADAVAVANPLRGLTGDAEYVAASVATVDGPVLLVGHGYGAAVSAVAATSADNVVGLVYVAGLVADDSVSCVELLRYAFLRALRPARVSVAGRRETEVLLDRSRFADLVAADLTTRVAATLAATQRPIVAAALAERPAHPARHDLPCWYLVAATDRVVAADAQRGIARRAGARTVEVVASHAVLRSRPEATAALIHSALAAIQ